MKITESERKKILGKYYSPQNLDIIFEQVYSSDPKVREIQNLLIKKGYDLGRYGADGKLGPKTLAAINSYFKVGAEQAPANQTTPTDPAAPNQAATTPAGGQTQTQGTGTPTAAPAATTPAGGQTQTQGTGTAPPQEELSTFWLDQGQSGN
jgi:peptidoglycan hydrolase-like protein with peptidoglycan-binding domain